jgi:ComF family protein
MLAEAISELDDSFEGKPVVVVPVPLHARKMRQRGFNQAELIARAALKTAHSAKLVLEAKLLERRRETQSQIGLSRHQRRENIRGAFAVVKPEKIAGSSCLLVDDLFTTGTTVSECARILLRAGASNVWVATVARTLKAEANFAEVEFEKETPIAVAAAG